jgi:hypothetical protein
MKTIESRIAPNPMEAQIWVDLSEDPHGLVKKYWNGTKWITKGGNGVSKEEVLKSLEPQLNAIKDQLKDLKSVVDFLSTYHDEYILKMIKELADRIAKLEQFIVTE